MKTANVEATNQQQARRTVALHPAARRIPLIGLLCFFASLFGCSSNDQSAAERTALLQIRDTAGAPVGAFVAYITDNNGPTHTIACDIGSSLLPGESWGATCQDAALQLPAVSGPLEVTIKSRGYAFWTGSLDVAKAPPNRAPQVTDVVLTRLGPFEHTADYDTGFEPETGLAGFTAAAVTEDTELGSTQIVKFYIADLDGTPQPYFQHTKEHPLHYGFARDVLGRKGTLSDFEAQTYSGAKRTAMAGSILYRSTLVARSSAYGGNLVGPLSVTFFPSDDLTPDQALFALRLLEERIGFVTLYGPNDRLVYEPAGAVQESAANSARTSFARAGSLAVTLGEIYAGLTVQVLNPGTTYGRLRVMSAEQLVTTPVSYSDLLVLTRLPNELPTVAGTITEELQTPLSHVNVAARARGTPNIALKGASTDSRIAPHIGNVVRFEVRDGDFSLTDVTEEEANAYWQARVPAAYVPTSDVTAEGLPAFEELNFAAASSVGVKAANLAELSRLLGPLAPEGFAVPFHYYDRFMQQLGITAASCQAAYGDCTTEGRSASLCLQAMSLCNPVGADAESFQDHVSRVLSDAEVRINSDLREAVLNNLRYVMRHTPVDESFATLLDSRVFERFGNRKIRLRSSTNAEDLEGFSGAGSYDSFSANSSEDGPASKQVRKVWASVWNFAAYEERAYWNIDHLAVRMACAVHQAFPNEAANGVLITQNIAEPAVAGMYVNVQKAEVSVTNPEDGSIPEVFSILPAPSGVQVQRQRYSSLSPGTPLLSDAEVRQLYRASLAVQQRFAKLYAKSPEILALDIEFKFNLPDRALILKQVRPYTSGFVP